MSSEATVLRSVFFCPHAFLSQQSPTLSAAAGGWVLPHQQLGWLGARQRRVVWDRKSARWDGGREGMNTLSRKKAFRVRDAQCCHPCTHRARRSLPVGRVGWLLGRRAPTRHVCPPFRLYRLRSSEAACRHAGPCPSVKQRAAHCAKTGQRSRSTVRRASAHAAQDAAALTRVATLASMPRPPRASPNTPARYPIWPRLVPLHSNIVYTNWADRPHHITDSSLPAVNAGLDTHQPQRACGLRDSDLKQPRSVSIEKQRTDVSHFWRQASEKP